MLCGGPVEGANAYGAADTGGAGGIAENLMCLVVLPHTGAAWRLVVLTGAPLIQRAAARAAQEYFVEDLLEVLMHITQHTPAVLEGARMEEVLMFLVVFLNSPQHVRNPYLRGKMVEVRVVLVVCPVTACPA